MDMTVINGVRMSKYDIRALKVGLKVTPEMRDTLTEFNKNFVGEHSVFPVKNGAPRILEQFKDNPYTLELLDQYTTGNKPKKLPTAGATYYQGKPATRKVLEHFVRTGREVRRSTMFLALGHSPKARSRHTKRLASNVVLSDDGRASQ